MKFKLFGGLDCPDTLLAQLAVVGNTDIVTLKALGALADHVITVMLLNVCANSSSAVGDNTTAGSSSSSMSLSTENEIRASTIKLFEDVMKPLIQAAAANETGGSSSSSSSVTDHRFDNFAVKAVAFHESQRLQRAKAAYAAAKKFVVTATADEIEQLSLQPASLQQQLLIAEDALSQALVALDHVIANVARFNINDEVLHKELTMLGMSPEAVEVILSSIKSSISAFRDRLGEDDAKEKGSAYFTALTFILGVEGSNGGDAGNLGISAETGGSASSPKKVKSGGEEASAGAVLRQIGLYKCPRIGAQSPIGAIIPFVRTSTLAAVQTITSAAEEDAEGEKEEEDASKVQAEAEEALTDLDSGASSTAIIKLFTTSDRNGCGAKIIEMSHAQARTLLNELLVVRDIMRGGDAHHE